MKKDDLVLEYLHLASEYMSFASPDPVDEKRKEIVRNRLLEIRALLGMEKIQLT